MARDTVPREDSMARAGTYTNTLRESSRLTKPQPVQRQNHTHFVHHEPLGSKDRAFGIHTGLDIGKAINSSGDINSKPTTGFLAGIYYQHGLKLFGGRTELNYSRQGFQYTSGGSQRFIKNDYLSLATLTTITVLRRAQFEIGTVEGFLVNSQDSQGGGSGQASPLNAFNRFYFGLAAAVEAYPYDKFVLGVRYTLGLTNLIRRPDNSLAAFIPFYQVANSYNIHNGEFQIYLGYQLGF